jgi:hypothetical protein
MSSFILLAFLTFSVISPDNTKHFVNAGIDVIHKFFAQSMEEKVRDVHKTR